MKVKVKRRRETVEEIEVPKFHYTFFRQQYFDGQKIHSLSPSGEYIWLNADVKDLIKQTDRVKESNKETFLKSIDEAIENLKILKKKAENDNE